MTTIVLGLALMAGAQREPLRLDMKRALELALSREGSARIQIAEEGVKQSEARSAQARAALLPNLDAYTSYQNATRNLEAVGIQFNSPFPGVQIPTFVGPFSTFDLRGTARQSVFDLSSIRRYQAAKVGVSGARSERANTADQVAATVAKAYVAALRADADVEAVEANLRLAEEVMKLAESQKRAGTATGLDITRAEVQLANERQRLLVVQNDRRRAQLQLLRAIGLRLDVEVELTDKLNYVPVDEVALEEARKRAYAERSDLKAQLSREDSARLSASATKWERLPSVSAYADYGTTGLGVDDSLPTRTIGFSVNLPVFDGGRRDARRAESQSLYRQEAVRTRDLKDQIELELRVALDALESADEQVKVAREGLGLAEREYEHAKRRYESGVSSSIEVTDAQTRVERARDNATNALFNHNVARIDLALAQGRVMQVAGE
jgi:outer membrane protein TolC